MKLCPASIFLWCLFISTTATAASAATVHTVSLGPVDYTIILSPGDVVTTTNPFLGGNLGFDIQLNLSADPAFTDPAFSQNLINGNILLSSTASFVTGVTTVTAAGKTATPFIIGSGGNFRDFSSGFLFLPLGASFFGAATAFEYNDIYTYGFCLDPTSCTSNDVIGTFQDVVFVSPPVAHIAIPISIELDTPATTPLPTALPLFATGLGALGLLGWRRKRKAAAA